MRLNIHRRLFRIVLIMMIMGWGAAYAQVNRQSIESLLEENSFTYGLHNRRTELMGNSCSIYGLVLGFPHSTRMKHMLTLNSTVFWIGENPEVQLNYFGFAEEYDVERKFRETRLYQVAPISTNLILSYVSEHVLGLPRSY